MENKPNKIIIHHSADSSTENQAEKIDAYHKSLGFPRSEIGLYGGYHYLIERNGYIFEYRNETEIGAHDKDENINSIGICLAGNFNLETPTTAQCTALSSVLDRLLRDWHIPISRIEPHRWGDTTDCPGLRLDDAWAQRLYIKNKLSWLQQLLLWMTQKK